MKHNSLKTIAVLIIENVDIKHTADNVQNVSNRKLQGIYKEQLINVKKKKKKKKMMMMMMTTNIEIIVSQRFLFRAHLSDSQNNHESSHQCSRKYRVYGRKVSKI
jgi:hypothetical protein